MTVRYRIRHETRYSYQSDVVHSRQLLHLTPRSTAWQRLLSHEVSVGPATWRVEDDVDAFGNPVNRLECEQPHRSLAVVADMEVQVQARREVDAAQTEPWRRARDALAYRPGPRTPADLQAQCFRHESPYVRIKQALSDFAADCFDEDAPVLTGAEALMRKIHRELRYAPGETNVSTPLMEVLHARRGVCQDFAHLMIACLRSLGLAARYVSGYLRLLPRADGVIAQPDAGASHAWTAVYCPPHGWVELDPTNNVRVDTDHIAVAWGRDFGDVSPLRGVISGGGEHRLAVAVRVEPVTP